MCIAQFNQPSKFNSSLITSALLSEQYIKFDCADGFRYIFSIGGNRLYSVAGDGMNASEYKQASISDIEFYAYYACKSLGVEYRGIDGVYNSIVEFWADYDAMSC